MSVSKAFRRLRQGIYSSIAEFRKAARNAGLDLKQAELMIEAATEDAEFLLEAKQPVKTRRRPYANLSAEERRKCYEKITAKRLATMRLNKAKKKKEPAVK